MKHDLPYKITRTESVNPIDGKKVYNYDLRRIENGQHSGRLDNQSTFSPVAPKSMRDAQARLNSAWALDRLGV